MKLAFISDTHMQHARLTQHLADARPDVLVHCGDFSNVCRVDEVGDFADWCAMLLRKGYAKHVVVIAGNHDALFDVTSVAMHRHGRKETADDLRDRLRDAGVHYLQDVRLVIDGISFYGTPWTKRFYDWGFQIDSATQDRSIFDAVPDGIDVLVTHGPPLNIRDLCPRDQGAFENVGSPALLAALQRVKPRVHAFGHIHETAGMTIMPWGTVCVNAASLSRGPHVTMRLPVLLELVRREVDDA